MDDRFNRILSHYLSDKSTSLWRAKAEHFLRKKCPKDFDPNPFHDGSNPSNWTSLAILLSSNENVPVLNLLSKDLTSLSPFEALRVLDRFPKLASLLEDDDLVDLLDTILVSCPAAEPKLLHVLRHIIASNKWSISDLRSKYIQFYPELCSCMVLCLDAFEEDIEMTDEMIKVALHRTYWDERVFRRLFKLTKPQDIKLECGCFECSCLFILKTDLGLCELNTTFAETDKLKELSSKERERLNDLIRIFMQIRQGVQVPGIVHQPHMPAEEVIPPACDEDNDYDTLIEMLDHDHDHVVGYSSCCAECYCD